MVSKLNLCFYIIASTFFIKCNRKQKVKTMAIEIEAIECACASDDTREFLHSRNFLYQTHVNALSVNEEKKKSNH